MNDLGEQNLPDSLTGTRRFQASVGEVLRAARLHRKVGHKTAAAGAGCSSKCVRNNESAEANPELVTLYRLCRTYRLPLTLVALLIDLRCEGYLVPLSKAFEMARRVRPLLLKIVRF